MGGELCTNCKKGIMIRKGKGTKVVCTSCGQWKFRSPNGSTRGALIGAQAVPKKQIEEVRKIREEKLTEKEGNPKIPYPLNSEQYKMEKLMRDNYIRDMRKSMSVKKMLKKISKNKYSGLKGQEIMIEGQMWKVGEEYEQQ